MKKIGILVHNGLPYSFSLHNDTWVYFDNVVCLCGVVHVVCVAYMKPQPTG